MSGTPFAPPSRTRTVSMDVSATTSFPTINSTTSGASLRIQSSPSFVSAWLRSAAHRVTLAHATALPPRETDRKRSETQCSTWWP